MTRLEFTVSEPVVQAVYAGWAARTPGMWRDIAEFRAVLQSCDCCVSWWRGDTCMGAIFGHRPYLHIEFRPEFHGRWFSRSTMVEFLAWYFRIDGVMRSRGWVPATERMVQWLGFIRVNNDYYEYTPEQFRQWLERTQRRETPPPLMERCHGHRITTPHRD